MSTSFGDEVKRMFKEGSILIKLILVNVGVFVLVNLVGLVFRLMDSSGGEFLVNWLSSTSNLGDLLFKPWSVITYMFLHEDLMHIFWNMLILFFVGRIFLHFLGSRRMLSTYIIGGICGLLLYIISYNVFPVFWPYRSASIILGASASVMAIFIAAATYRPNYELQLFLLGSIKFKYIAMVYVLLDIISIRNGENSGGHIAHLGGAIFGYVYGRQLVNGRDLSINFYKLVDGIAAAFSRRQNVHVEYRRSKPVSDDDYNARKKEEQDRIDVILDKISKSGYDSLNKEEKAFLFRSSNGKK